MRIALGIEYDGTAYHGWQSQLTVKSVQEELEKALSFVADHPITIFCAGRTDKGVHASAQVVHFDTTVQREQQAWTLGVNSRLPDDISVRWYKEVGEVFHARYSATARHYRYQIHNHPLRSSLYRHRAAWHCAPLDADKMNAAAQYLLGEHDFSSFRAAGCQSKSPIRDLRAIDVKRQGDFIQINVTANAFLHHMVRNIVGSLLLVGEGEQKPSWIAELLIARDRTVAGITAAPEGLCLVGVDY